MMCLPAAAIAIRRALQLVAVIFILGWQHPAHAQAGTCRKTGEVCMEAGAKEISPGVIVNRPCWKYQDTYECTDPNAVNYCAALQTWPGCVMLATTCTATDWSGRCLNEDKTYRCATNYSGPTQGVITLPATHTISSTQDVSQCVTPEGNPACFRSGADVCVQGPETRVINGVPVYKDCWQWQRNYACVNESVINYCAPLEALGCTATGTPTCIENGPDGLCNIQQKTFNCSNNASVAGSNIVNLNTSYTVTRDARDATACASPESNPSCQAQGEVCTEGPETRTINGLAVYKECWKWEKQFACASAAPMDYCQPLRAAGCTQQSRTCATTGPDGICNEYTTTFTCNNNGGVAGTKVENLNTSYTIVQDSIDVSACADPAANPSCTLAEEVCVEPGGTRTINGLPVTKDCWKWDRRYTCTVAGGADFCSPLRAQSGCSTTGTTCLQFGTNGQCIASENTYRCDNKIGDPLPEGVTYLNSEYTIVKDTLIDQCTEKDGNPGCQKVGQVCTEPGGTRVINGLPVTKDCWAWESTYTCYQPENEVNTCGSIATDPNCTLAREQCAIDKYTGVPDCNTKTKVFSCRVSPEKTQTTDVCKPSTCIGDVCSPEEDDPDNDFGQAIAGLELQRQAANYVDDTGRIFRGVSQSCEHRLFGVTNCCKEKVQAASAMSNASMSAPLTQFAFQAVKKYGSEYVYDPLLNAGIDLLKQVGTAVGGTVAEKTLALGKVQSAQQGLTFQMYGVTMDVSKVASILTNGGGITEVLSSGFAFDPYSFAFQVGLAVLQKLASCNQEEQYLALKKGQRLCTYVGSYKTGKVFRRRFEGYCCYNSRLARIIQEGVRSTGQLSRSYGHPENPDCSGLTPTEMEAIDFSRIDLSEFVAEVVNTQLDSTAALQRAQQRQASAASATSTNKNAAITQGMPATPASRGATDRAPGTTTSTTTTNFQPKTEPVLRGCDAPLALDDKTGACKDSSGRFYYPYGGGPMPCATGKVKDSAVDACVDPNTGQYYPLNSNAPMPCVPGKYLAPGNVCKEPNEP